MYNMPTYIITGTFGLTIGFEPIMRAPTDGASFLRRAGKLCSHGGTIPGLLLPSTGTFGRSAAELVPTLWTSSSRLVSAPPVVVKAAGAHTYTVLPFHPWKRSSYMYILPELQEKSKILGYFNQIRKVFKSGAATEKKCSF